MWQTIQIISGVAFYNRSRCLRQHKIIKLKSFESRQNILFIRGGRASRLRACFDVMSVASAVLLVPRSFGRRWQRQWTYARRWVVPLQWGLIMVEVGGRVPASDDWNVALSGLCFDIFQQCNAACTAQGIFHGVSTPPIHTTFTPIVNWQSYVKTTTTTATLCPDMRCSAAEWLYICPTQQTTPHPASLHGPTWTKCF